MIKKFEQNGKRSFYFSKFVLAMMLLSIMNFSYAQDLKDYAFRTGVDTSKWITLTSNATELLGTNIDGWPSDAINIGFNFTFGEETYSQYSVNTDGAMRLGPGTMGSAVLGTTGTEGMFTSSTYNTYMPKISGCTKDLGTCSNGYVRSELFGTASNRILVVEYKLCYQYSTTNNADVMWQVQLHEDSNKVVLVYASSVPEIVPSGYQTGLGTSGSDFCLIDPSTHAATFYTTGQSTTYTTWHGTNRYYEFVRILPSCPRPLDLEVSDVESSVANVGWTQIGSPSQWLIKYGVAGFDLDTDTTAASVIVSDTTATIQNLLPNTDYDLYVRAICSSTDSSRWTKVSFTTECEEIIALPWEANLESNNWVTLGTFKKHPTCWKLESEANYSWYNTTSLSYIRTGTAAICFDGSNRGQDSWLITPVIHLNGDEQLSFWVKNSSNYSTVTSNTAIFSVYAYTVTEDSGTEIELSDFEQISSQIEMLGVNNYSKIVVPLTGLAGKVRLAFVVDTVCSRFYIDDVVVDTTPACQQPLNLVVDNITQNSADISWTGNATSYIIEYGLKGFNLGDGTVVVSNTNSYVLTNLDSNTVYTFYVSSVYSNGDTSDWSQFTKCFRTECAIVTTLPWVANLESDNWLYHDYPNTSGQYPYCWQIINGGNPNYYWGKEVTSSEIRTGTAALLFDGTSVETEHDDWIITPEIVLTGNEQLNFWVKNYTVNEISNNVAIFSVYVCPIDPNELDFDTSDFVQIGSRIRLSGVNEYTEYTVPLTEFTGNVRLAFVVDSASNLFQIDDIEVKTIDRCLEPSFLSVSEVTKTSAELSWLGIGSSYIVEYGPTGFELGTGNIVVTSNNYYSLTNLEPGTEYRFYVRSMCSSDTSDYSSIPGILRTECAEIVALPWVPNLEEYNWVGDSSPYCWDYLNGGNEYAKWTNVIGESYVRTGTAAIRYNSSNNDSDSIFSVDWLITPVLPLIGNEQLNFWMHVPVGYSSDTLVGRFAIYACTVNENDDVLDISRFVCVYPRIEMLATTDFVEYTLPLTNLTGNVRLAFVIDTVSDKFYIDDLMVETIPTCPKPRNLVVNNVEQTTADLSWDCTANAYIVEYGPIGFELGTGTMVTSNTNFCTLSGLDHSSGYDYYVRAVCSSFDTSLYSSLPGTFFTECGAVTTFPWEANLESDTWVVADNGTDVYPSCWNSINGANTSYSWTTETSASMIKTGTAAIKFMSTLLYNSPHNDWLITPEFVLSGNEQLSFWIKNGMGLGLPLASLTSRLTIYACNVDENNITIDTSAFVRISPSIEVLSVNSHIEFIVPLTELTGNVRLAFVVDTVSAAFSIDDIRIDRLPCSDTYTTTIYDTICANEIYTANGFNTNIAGTHVDTLQTVFGCDSIVTLILTVKDTSASTEVVTACDYYTWIDGVTYTESTTTPTYTYTATNGCDSVVTLNLTINRSTSGIDVITACDSYTWIDGVTYTESNNTATYTLTNVAGCDSIVTLNLTINNSTTGTDVVTACDSYTWIDGVTYTESNNTATYTLTNAMGCDSIVTLNLTVNYAVYDTIVDTAMNEYTWNGTTYTESGVYEYAGETTEGCDSIVTLMLTITTVGIDAANEPELTFYPNPTSGTITFNHTDIRKVEVLDGMGRMVAVFENSYRIDISQLAKGYYTMRITTSNGITIRRVVKQ